jgi:16S rRNA (guanine527-N7)-methyltransferase
MTIDRPSHASAGVAGLVSRYRLPREAQVRLEVLVDLLVSHPLAPTAVREAQRVIDDHLADALVALECERVRGASSIADLGSGPGIPGLPLGVALPRADVALIESSARKCAFLAIAIDACEVENARVVHTRAESWRAGLGKMDLVTARALAPLPVVAEYAAPLLALGGALVVWRGARDPDEEAAAARAADELGLEVREPVRVLPYDGAERRHLHLMLKVRPTPRGFPRRPGMARKRPLGATRPLTRAEAGAGAAAAPTDARSDRGRR